MAGFPPFPVPRYINTRAYWYFVKPSLARKNFVAVMVSFSLSTLAIWRYAALRWVIIELFSKPTQNLTLISPSIIKMLQKQQHSMCDLNSKQIINHFITKSKTFIIPPFKVNKVFSANKQNFLKS